jgi:tetratricopeptide (TPR) repeat protein
MSTRADPEERSEVEMNGQNEGLGGDRIDSEKVIHDLRREILEARNLIIKTDNAIKSLHAEMKQVSKRQEQYERRAWMASGVAYGGFAILAIVGAFAVASVRTAHAKGQASAALKQAQALQADLTRAKGDQEAQRTTREAATKVYEQMSGGDEASRLAGLQAEKGIDKSKLLPLEARSLDDRAKLLRAELSEPYAARGRAAWKRQDFRTAATELARALEIGGLQGEEQGTASFYLGTARIQLRDATGAIPPLEQFIKLGRPRTNLDYAHVLLGEAFERTGAPDKAATIYRKGANEFPNSQFAPILRSRSGRLASAKPPEGQQAPAAPAAPAQPAP